ncbi:GH10318 [Drosophila grimshawi]|uniref:GH10318 n=2 Tax=Drosophila grimshawi TaxID=7222 RepID=B4JA99_DROGR|nr:GH10318 [Drosophila grimshawi]
MSGIVIVGSILMMIVFAAGHINLYGPNDDVVELTTANFEHKVLQDDAIWIVKFYATWCSYCNAMVPEYKKLAKALKGVAKVGAVDGEQHYELCSTYEVRGFPMIKIFGVNKTQPSEYFEARNAEQIAKAVVAEIQRKLQLVIKGQEDVVAAKVAAEEEPESDVIELQTDDFAKQVLNSNEIWLVAFYTPYCKALTAEWIQAANELSGKGFKLGAMDVSKHMIKEKEYKFRDCLTIKYFPANTRLVSNAQDYHGKRNAADIISWAVGKLEVPQLLQLIDEASLYAACEEKSWCVISVLPSLLDCNARCRHTLLHSLRKLSEKFKLEPFGWLWNEAGEQPVLEEGLQVTNSGYPALVAVNCEQMQFSVFNEPFTHDNLVKFLGDIANNRGHKMHINCAQRPAINQVAAWEGDDVQLSKKMSLAEREITDEL